MKGGDCGDGQRVDEVQDVAAVRSSPDPELVLDRDGLDAAGEDACRSSVVGVFVATDPVVDFQRVGQVMLTRVEGDDLPIARRR